MADGSQISILSLKLPQAGEILDDDDTGKENHLIALSLASVAANYIEPELLEAHNLGEGFPVTLVGPNNEIITASDIAIPPDGGWGWVVVLASFLTNAVIDGMIFSFGLLQDDIKEKYDSQHPKESHVPTSKVAVIGSLMLGFSLLSGPFCSALANKFGFRAVGMSGCYVTAISFLIALSLRTNEDDGEPNINALIIFYGMIGGIGIGLIYVPSVITVGFYFEKRRALAVGLAISGTGFGTMIFAPLVKHLVGTIRWDGTVVVQACLIFSCSLLTVLYRPLLSPKDQQDLQKQTDKAMNVRWYSYNKKHESKLAKYQNTPQEELIFREELTCPFITHALTEDCYCCCCKGKQIPIPMVRRRRRSSSLPKKYIDGQRRSMADIIRIQSRETLNRPMYRDDIFFGGSLRQITSTAEATTIAIPTTPHPDEQQQLDTIPEDESEQQQQQPGTSTLSKAKIQEPAIANEGTNLLKVSKNASTIPLKGSTDKFDLPLEPKKGSHTPIKDQFEIIKDRPGGSYTSAESIEPEFHQHKKSIPILIIPPYKKKCCGPQNVVRKMLDITILKSPTFIVLALGGFLNSLGYIVPFTYLPKFAEENGIPKNSAALLLSYMGISNTVGRIVCGYFSDSPRVNTLILNNAALTVAGLGTILIPTVASLGYPVFILYGVTYGLCMACWAALRSILLVKLLGLGKLTNSFGLLLMFQGMASLVASPLAGFLRDLTHHYDTSFYVGGSLVLCSALVCYPLGYINRNERASAIRSKEKNSA